MARLYAVLIHNGIVTFNTIDKARSYLYGELQTYVSGTVFAIYNDNDIDVVNHQFITPKKPVGKMAKTSKKIIYWTNVKNVYEVMPNGSLKKENKSSRTFSLLYMSYPNTSYMKRMSYDGTEQGARKKAIEIMRSNRMVPVNKYSVSDPYFTGFEVEIYPYDVRKGTTGKLIGRVQMLPGDYKNIVYTRANGDQSLLDSDGRILTTVKKRK